MEKLGEKLDKIVKHTSPTDSFLLTLSGQGSRIEKTFQPEISINPGCHYKIAFTSLETYFSIPNIDESNNTLSISRLTEPWRTVTLDKGSYGLLDLNVEIGRQLKDFGLDKGVVFKANYNTFKCVIHIQGGYTVKFTENSLRSVLGYKGFGLGMVKRFVSEHTVLIMNVNSILVHCDLVSGSYLNGQKAPIIHSFVPLADPGEKIVEKPVEYIYLPIPSDVIRHMTVWLTDQNERLLDIGEEILTIKFHLISC